jgi:hypothetical protein
MTQGEQIAVRWLGGIGAGLASFAGAAAAGAFGSMPDVVVYASVAGAVGAGLTAIVTFVKGMSAAQ